MKITSPPSYTQPSAYQQSTQPDIHGSLKSDDCARFRRTQYQHLLETHPNDVDGWRRILRLLYIDMTTSDSFAAGLAHYDKSTPVDQFEAGGVPAEVLWRKGLDWLYRVHSEHPDALLDAITRFYQLLMTSNCRGHYRSTLVSDVILCLV
jgi:hypothetical protein